MKIVKTRKSFSTQIFWLRNLSQQGRKIIFLKTKKTMQSRPIDENSGKISVYICYSLLSREENSSFSHEERGILIRVIPCEEIIRGKRGIRGFRCYVFLSCFFFVMVFICFLRKKSLELFWKILMNFLKSPYEFLEKSLWIYLKNPYGFFYCYGFSSSFFFAKSKKTITIKKSIWFFLKNSYGFF